jgi:type IV pilus assembly protein PilE
MKPHMTKHNLSPRPYSTGFTLIELMIAVVVASILLTIAIPSYRSYILKSHRTDAKTALLDLAGREERYYNTNNAYTLTQAGLGYGTAGNVSGLLVGGNYYQVTVSNVNAATPTAAATYTIQAVAVGTQLQDTACVSYTVTQTGAQTALNSSGVLNSTTCW